MAERGVCGGSFFEGRKLTQTTLVLGVQPYFRGDPGGAIFGPGQKEEMRSFDGVHLAGGKVALKPVRG